LTTLLKDATQAPQVIAHKSSATRGELLVQPEAYKEFLQQAHLNDTATRVDELYANDAGESMEVLRCPSMKRGRVSMLRAALGYAHKKCGSSRRLGEADEGGEWGSAGSGLDRNGSTSSSRKTVVREVDGNRMLQRAKSGLVG
jgi:hypothetical protein